MLLQELYLGEKPRLPLNREAADSRVTCTTANGWSVLDDFEKLIKDCTCPYRQRISSINTVLSRLEEMERKVQRGLERQIKTEDLGD